MEKIGRYKKMAYKEALGRSLLYYPTVCKELSLILREAFHHLPKPLQSLVFNDLLSTFRLLPKVHTRNALSAAHHLLKSAEAILPKQKKNLVVSEFKFAKIQQKRRHRVNKEEESIAELPTDVLAHIFSYLDMRSLVSAGLVCWSWNLAASDNQLWQTQYAIYFGDIDSLKTKELQNCRIREHRKLVDKQENVLTGNIIDWREVFRKEYTGSSSKRLDSNRGYCSKCKVVWLDNTKCLNEGTRNHHITFMSSRQVVDYLVHGTLPSSDGDSDDESDDEDLAPWCWTYPRLIDSSQIGM